MLASIYYGEGQQDLGCFDTFASDGGLSSAPDISEPLRWLGHEHACWFLSATQVTVEENMAFVELRTHLVTDHCC